MRRWESVDRSLRNAAVRHCPQGSLASNDARDGSMGVVDPAGGWTDPEPDLEEDGRQPGLLAYDLGRRGFWALEPGQPTQLELAVDDSAGTLIVHQAPLGILGTVELQVAIALAAVWGETDRDRVFPFRIADLVERMELSWSGQTVRDLDPSPWPAGLGSLRCNVVRPRTSDGARRPLRTG